ncbi:MAG: heavy metal translocating P-type ATPase metal-binding domain-containing protein [Saprospiraceae bacterium]|nr:heavy metal translocating P-type ATPase metal-binding domain-containing protein [Saprospiraceae bacterium]MCC6414236.1 heavy metal translocating P-type ATPase metal-binding domain-containing protein [Saprospiraceae bacterium]
MKHTTALSPAKPAPDAQLACYHCHDVCPNDKLHLEDKYFCCEGCQLVYQILNENDMCQYYRLDDQPGLSLKNRRDARAYAWLDDKEVRDKLIRYADAQQTHVVFYLPTMHCASCIWLLEHLYKLDEGVHHSSVNFLKKEVTIQFDESVTNLRKLASLLDSLGYPPEINLGDVEGTTQTRIDRSLYYKIGVAGFAFGNIMLLSFPEYLGLEKEHEAWFFNVFGYLNLVLALPVLLYSSRDYFISAWNGLRHGHLNIDVPLALGMVMLFGRSAWEIIGGDGAGYMDSFAGLIFFLLTGKWFQHKTYDHLSFERDYRSYFPVAASVKQPGGQEQTIPVQKLSPGDIIIIRHGELIPADGILLKGNAQIDYSFVTGESLPVSVNSGERMFAGGKQQGETIEISLTRKVSTSYLTQLWNDDAFKDKSKSHASLLADRAGRYFTTLILGVASLAFLYWAPQNITTAVNAFTAVLIIACPCAVALSIPFTMGNVLRILGRNRFYAKNTQVLENLHTPDRVVFDKTGTITKIATNSVRFKPLEGQPVLKNSEMALVKTLVFQSNHPASRQIAESMGDVPVGQVTHFEETSGKGIQAEIEGKKLLLGSAAFVVPEMKENPGVFVQIDGVVRGFFEINNRYREGLDGVLRYFAGKNVDASLLSGDNDREAKALSPMFKGNMRFNQAPGDKLTYVKSLRENGHNVLMFGDGLNDAGALQQSNIGIVVAENTNNFTPACDAIVHADEFERLPDFFDLAKWGVNTVNRAYLLAGAYNVVGLSYAVTGTLSPVIAAILMPLSSVSIILFGYGMTYWKAWKMGLMES